MNDGNIRAYLTVEMNKIKDDIEILKTYIKSNEQSIDDHLKRIQNLKIHYTSLLNTAIAYGCDIEDDEQEEG